jgi:AbrB family looped-hinge helix DNA binding protein
MIATVTKKRQVVLPAQVCEQLGIRPGARLDFRAKKGKLEAVKLPDGSNSVRRDLKRIYTARRNAEELIIQKGCSCEVPDDFSQ